MPNVLLGTPTTRDFPATYVRSLFTTTLKGKLAWLPLFGQAIDVGRNMVCKNFVENYPEFDYLVMHDSDASWAPDAVQRLVDRNLPVVTAVIFKRGIPTVPTIGKDIGISTNGNHLYSFADTVNRVVSIAEREGINQESENVHLFEKRSDDIEEIDACGSHFMAIRRDVLEAIGLPWFECTTVNGGEDFDFCRKVKKAGYKLYVDYSVFTGHNLGGTMEIGIRELMLFSDKAKLETVWIA